MVLLGCCRRSFAIGIAVKKTVGRMATYLQAYGDLMVRTNQWNPKYLSQFRDSEIIKNFQGAIDQKASFKELQDINALIPNSWLSNAALGTPKECVSVINRQFELGCDGVILHGVSPQELCQSWKSINFRETQNVFLICLTIQGCLQVCSTLKYS